MQRMRWASRCVMRIMRSAGQRMAEAACRDRLPARYVLAASHATARWWLTSTVSAMRWRHRCRPVWRCRQVGAEIHLITHLIVREDQHTLYGFASEAERQLFRDLIKVNRVGAKLALGILSGMSVGTFISLCANRGRRHCCPNCRALGARRPNG